MRKSFVAGVGGALSPTSERDTLAAGIDIIPDRRSQNLGAKRAKGGECPTCGQHTHKVVLFGKNKPLTVEGRVYKGRCLACHPVEGYIRRPPGPPQQGPAQSQPNIMMQPPHQPPSYPHPSYPHQPYPHQPYPHPHPRQHPSYPHPQLPYPYYPQPPPQFYPPHPPHPPPNENKQQQPLPPQEPTRDAPPRTLIVEPDEDASIVSGITLDPGLIRNWTPADRFNGHEHSRIHNNDVERQPNQHGQQHDQYHYNGVPASTPEHEEFHPGGTPEGFGVDGYPYPNSAFGRNNASYDDRKLPPGNMDGSNGTTDSDSDSNRRFGPPRTESVDSGPTYQPDDLPTYVPPATHPKAQTPEPAFFLSPVSGGGNITGSAMASPSLQSHKTTGPGIFAKNPGNRRHDADKGMSARIDSRRSADSADSSFAPPPLIERGLRGRPDDDKIEDPMSNIGAGIERGGPAHQDPAFEERFQGKKNSIPPPSEMDKEASREPRENAEETRLPPSRNDQSHEASAASKAEPPSADVSVMVQKLAVEPPAREAGTAPSPGPDKNSQRTKNSKRKSQSIQEIPAILHCLNLDEANSKLREKALTSLSEILWKAGTKAREFIVQYKGIDTLVKTMWAEMENVQVQYAAAEFLLALAASHDGKASSDLLSNEESIIDSLLFSMQMHAMDTGVQLKGCGVLSCLAAASSNNSRISDGTLSGAMMMVLNAMSKHGASLGIQKAGMQALYFQCSLSSNAESNKRSLLESSLDNGLSGLDIITSAVDYLKGDILAIEWATHLFWCLTSSEDLVKSLSGSAMVGQVLHVCQHHMASPEAAALVEACFGVIGNFAHAESNRSDLLKAGATTVLIEGMRFHRADYGANIEACSAIANLAVSPALRDSLAKAGAVGSVIHALQSFVEQAELVGEAMRALVCLAIDSPESKEMMAIPQVITSISHACQSHQGSALSQEMSSALLASLAVGLSTSDKIIEHGGADLLTQATSSNPEEKVQDAVCVAYRNLSCQVDNSDPLLRSSGMVSSLVKAMQSHENVASIQLNACCTLWNLACKTGKEPGTIVGPHGIKCIVKAMQNNMESGELLEVACGALWSLVGDSTDRKRDVVGNGAIDAVASAVLMHPNNTSTLEKAFGVLSNVSLEGPLAEAIANAHGVSIIVEAMRNNGSATSLLEVGCVALRNIVFQFPDFSEEVSGVISTIINAMREHIDAVGFKREACNLLWVLSAEDENCHSKILALDGITVLMNCLEHNSDIPEVRVAALGAFNQLASNP